LINGANHVERLQMVLLELSGKKPIVAV